MAIHALVLKDRQAGDLLEGRAWIYAHLSPAARSPYGRVMPGERIWIRQSGGPFIAMAEVDRVMLQDQLDAPGVDAIRREYGGAIGADGDFWESHRGTSRVAMLVWLRKVHATSTGPRIRVAAGRTWYVLEDDAAPAVEPTAKPKPAAGETFEVQMTEEQLKNGHLVVGKMVSSFPEQCLAKDGRPGAKMMLRLDGSGEMVITDLVRDNGVRFRWSQWGPWYKAQGMKAGDQVQFRRVEEGIYQVRRVAGGIGKKA